MMTHKSLEEIDNFREMTSVIEPVRGLWTGEKSGLNLSMGYVTSFLQLKDALALQHKETIEKQTGYMLAFLALHVMEQFENDKQNHQIFDLLTQRIWSPVASGSLVLNTEVYKYLHTYTDEYMRLIYSKYILNAPCPGYSSKLKDVIVNIVHSISTILLNERLIPRGVIIAIWPTFINSFQLW